MPSGVLKPTLIGNHLNVYTEVGEERRSVAV